MHLPNLDLLTDAEQRLRERLKEIQDEDIPGNLVALARQLQRDLARSGCGTIRAPTRKPPRS